MNSLYDLLAQPHKAIYELVVNNLEKNILEFSSMFQSYYTGHGKAHCNRVLEKIDNLLEENTEFKERLNSFEVLVLLLSVWLHDIGRISNLSGDRTLPKEVISRKHHILSYNIIKKYHYKLGILDETIADFVAHVSKAHNWDIDLSKEFPFIEVPIGDYSIRPRIISLLLRYGDIMDSDYRRAPDIIFVNLVKMPLESRIHWLGLHMIKGLKYEKGVVTVYAIFSDAYEEEILHWKLLSIYQFFLIYSNMLNENRLLYKSFICQITAPDKKYTIFGDEQIKKSKKPVDIEIYEKNKDLKFHSRKKEYFFMVDCIIELIQINMRKQALLSTMAENNKQKIKIVENEIDNLFFMAKESIKKEQHKDRYFLFLKDKIIQIMEKEYNKRPLSDTEIWLKSHMLELSKTLRFVNKYLTDCDTDCFSLLILLRYGYSPLRNNISKAIATIKSEIEKSGKGFHTNCVQCTARALMALLFANEEDCFGDKSIFQTSLKWFRTLKKEKWMGIEDNFGNRKEITYEYSRSALEFFIEYNDQRNSKALANMMVKDYDNWLKNIEHDDIHAMAYILFPIVRYCKVTNDVKCYEHITKYILNFLEMFDISKSDYRKRNALMGLLVWPFIKDDLLRQRLKKSSIQVAEMVKNDPTWASDGSWGWDVETTRYRAYSWLFALNIFCKFEIIDEVLEILEISK